MGESSNVMSNDARIQLVKSKHRKIKFRDTMLSVSGIALFFLIWELLTARSCAMYWKFSSSSL